MSVLVRRPTDGVDVVLLDRPHRRNAVDAATVHALYAAITAAATEPTVRAIVLASRTAGMFCSGADLRVSDAERAEVSDRLYALYAAMIRLPVPIIAAVDGAAVGGGAQLVLAADIRVGSPRAAVRFAGPGHGLAVGLWALPSAVGRGTAMDLALSGRLVAAEEAHRLGLLDRIVDDPLDAAVELAGHIATLDRAAVARAKAAVVDGERLAERLAGERAGNAAFTGAVPPADRPAGPPADPPPGPPAEPSVGPPADPPAEEGGLARALRGHR
jgi:enoyl-CoA hydratase/carnithine racemase